MIQEGVQTASGAQPSGTVLLKGDRHESWLSRFAAIEHISPETVLAYNRAACSWRDDEFGKPARWVHPLKGPTFYASRLLIRWSAPKGHRTPETIHAELDKRAKKEALSLFSR